MSAVTQTTDMYSAPPDNHSTQPVKKIGRHLGCDGITAERLKHRAACIAGKPALTRVCRSDGWLQGQYLESLCCHRDRVFPLR